jgi:hypothetical protein
MKKPLIFFVLMIFLNVSIFCAEEIDVSNMPRPDDGFLGFHIIPSFGAGILAAGKSEHAGNTSYNKTGADIQLEISYGLSPKRRLRMSLYLVYLARILKSDFPLGYEKGRAFFATAGYTFSFFKEGKRGFLPFAGVYAGAAFIKISSSLYPYEISKTRPVFVIHSGIKYFFSNNFGISLFLDVYIIPKMPWVNKTKSVVVFTPSIGSVFRF